MPWASAECRKNFAIQGILGNQTYMEDSGLYQHLKEYLSRLPAQVLGDLHFLINLKVEGACNELSKVRKTNGG